jgi:hypothetical protein
LIKNINLGNPGKGFSGTAIVAAHDLLHIVDVTKTHSLRKDNMSLSKNLFQLFVLLGCSTSAFAANSAQIVANSILQKSSAGETSWSEMATLYQSRIESFNQVIQNHHFSFADKKLAAAQFLAYAKTEIDSQASDVVTHSLLMHWHDSMQASVDQNDLAAAADRLNFYANHVLTWLK